MPRQVTRWATDDGKEFASQLEARKHEALLEGRRHLCPKCGGSGTQPGESIYGMVQDVEATAFGGQFASPVFVRKVVGHKRESCVICDGWGYTVSKMVPKFDSVQSGWEPLDD